MTTIKVYMDDGRVFEYDIESADKAREHSAAIIASGYRSTDNDAGTMEHYPPNRILKVKCVGGMTTQYPDRVSGT